MGMNNYENEIDLFDLAMYLLRRWKVIVIGTLAGMGLFAAGAFVLSNQEIVKWLLIGAILGMVAVCGVFFMIYVFGGYLRVKEELTERYGYVLLGTVSDYNEDIGNLIAQKVQMLKDDEKDIVVAGTLPGTECGTIYQGLCASINVHSNATVVARPMKSAKNLEQLADRQVVLVEKIGVTKTREMHEMATFLTASGTKVVGVVIVLS